MHIKQMYSPRLPRLYKNRDLYVLFIPAVHAFGSVNFTHTLGIQTNTLHKTICRILNGLELLFKKCLFTTVNPYCRLIIKRQD